MSSLSPASVLYGSDGTELSVSLNTAIPAGTKSLIVSGSDGTNARPFAVDSSGRTVVVGAGTAGTPAGGVLTIQGVASGTAVTVSGTVTANAGTGNFNNASVSATGSSPPASATYLGGSVTTAAPSYTNGQMSGLSLTTAGLLRVDNSGVTQPVSGTVAATQSGTWTVQPGNTANTTPWLASISQGGNTAAVKAASTAAVASDPALVVAISPNNSFNTSTADVTGTGALGSLNAAVTVTLAGLPGVGFQLAAGTLVGTILAELSFDGGTTWNTTPIDLLNGSKVNSIVFGSSNTATAGTIVGAGGAGIARIRVSAYTSGTANITLRASSIIDPSVVFTGPAAGALPLTIGQVGGSVTTAAPSYSNGTLNALSLTTAGLLRVDASGTTQPVSGTVTANQGTANTNVNGWFARLTDGTSNVAVKAASTAAVAADPALVVALSPNNNTLANALFVKNTDGTNTAAVKAASTAPVASDPALVVTISPNSTVSVVTDKATTSSVTSVTAATSSTSILASNAARVGATIFNESNKIMYVKLGTTASVTSYTIPIFARSYWELPASYTGAIDAIWETGVSGAARITELS